MEKIVIDPACGGKYVGHQSFHHFASIVEKDYVLQLSKIQEDLFKKHGFEVFLTRENDEDISLKERIAQTKNADFLISNHLNAGKKRGIEIRYSQHNQGVFASNLVKSFENHGFLVRACRTQASLANAQHDYDELLEQSGAHHSVMIFYGYVDSQDYETLTVSQNDYGYAVLEAIMKTNATI